MRRRCDWGGLRENRFPSCNPVPHGRRATRGILFQRMQHHRLDGLGNPGLDGPRRCGWLVAGEIENSLAPLAPERKDSGQGVVEHHAETVEIAAWIRVATRHHLGRDEGRGPQRCRGGGEARRSRRQRDAEIEHDHPSVPGDHDVPARDVAMDHSLVMRTLQSAARLDDDVRRFAPFERAMIEALLQGFSVDVREHDVADTIGFIGGEDRRYPWMVQWRGDPGLVEKPSPRVGRLGELVGQRLERHDPLEELILGLPNGRHPSLTDLGEDPIAPEGSADHWSSRWMTERPPLEDSIATRKTRGGFGDYGDQASTGVPRVKSGSVAGQTWRSSPSGT